jgi:ATP-dependent DNA helicase RecG
MSATQRTTKMLAHIKQHERISLREYQELCPDVNPDVLRGDFIELTERGKIMRVGDKRGTYYILK